MEDENIYTMQDDDELTLTGKQLKEWKDKIKQEMLEKIMGLDICANETPWYAASYEVLKDEIKKIILTGKSEIFEIKTYNDGRRKGYELAKKQQEAKP